MDSAKGCPWHSWIMALNICKSLRKKAGQVLLFLELSFLLTGGLFHQSPGGYRAAIAIPRGPHLLPGLETCAFFGFIKFSLQVRKLKSFKKRPHPHPEVCLIPAN